MSVNDKAIEKCEKALKSYKGHWIIKIEGKPESGGTIGIYECSNCHKKACVTEFPQYFFDEKGIWHDPVYCPWCGSQQGDIYDLEQEGKDDN